jgi:hypothetical protein
MKTMMNILLVVGLVAFAAGCDDDNNNGSMDMGGADLAEEKPDLFMMEQPDMTPVCSMSPMTHVELINACTNADFVDKMPFYPTLAPNGNLPAL